MSKKRPLSIRTLLALLGILAAFPAFAVIWRLGNRMMDTALEQALDQARAAVSTAAAVQEHSTGEVRGFLRALSEMPAIRAGDPEATRTLLVSILDRKPEYFNLQLLSPGGDVIATGRPHSWVRMAERKHVREALASRGFAAGEHLFCETTGEGVFPFAQAVLGEDGRPIAVLTASLSLDPRGDILMRGAPMPSCLAMGVLDHQGVRMLRLPPGGDLRPQGKPVDPALWRLMAGKPVFESGEVFYENGENWIISSRALRLSPGDEPYMYIVAGLARDKALGPLSQGIWANVGAMSLTVLLAMAMAMLLAELTIVRRLTLLTRASESIAAGRFATRVPMGGGPRELRGLARAFDSMAQALDKREANRRRLIRALRFSRKRFKDVAASMSDWIWETDPSGMFTFVSGRVRGVLGYLPEEMTGKMLYDFLIPGEKEKVRVLFEQGADAPVPVKGLEVWHEAKDGRRVCTLCNGMALMDSSGRLVGYRGVCVDVTVQKAAEERMLRSLGEKEVLLKEVHHRVKNNLQIISSLMSLESQEYPEIPEVELAFEHMRGRVRSIALIHQQLYASGDFAAVEMAGYITELANAVRSSQSLPGQNVHLGLELVPLHLSLNQALPLSLIVNEMVTNAFKHAFPDAGQGEVAIRLERHDGHVVLEVSDSGRGFDPEVVRGERHGLGFQLIMALADQLGGKVGFPENARGASIRLDFAREATP